MPSGSCLCGDIKYEYEGGNDVAHAACHCQPCQKSSGTPTSYNFLIPEDKFKVTSGKDKLRKWDRNGDSGQPVHYYSCPTCPTLIYVAADAMAGTIILKAGTLDGDVLAKSEPGMELYNKRRVPWFSAYGNAAQFDAGPA